MMVGREGLQAIILSRPADYIWMNRNYLKIHLGTPGVKMNYELSDGQLNDLARDLDRLYGETKKRVGAEDLEYVQGVRNYSIRKTYPNRNKPSSPHYITARQLSKTTCTFL